MVFQKTPFLPPNQQAPNDSAPGEAATGADHGESDAATVAFLLASICSQLIEGSQETP